MVERARDLHEPPPRRWRPAGSGRVSSAYSWAAISAAPSTPARGPWRAIRIVVFSPSPGTTWRKAASRAGSSSSSPARDTPPPITTSSGSNVLIALAIPIAEPLAEHAQAPQRRLVARLGAGDDVVAVDVALLARASCRGGVAVLDRGVVGQPVQRAAGGQRLQRAALRERVAGHVVAVLEVAPDDRVPDLGRGRRRAAVEAPVEHPAAADAGADREHDQRGTVIRPPSNASASAAQPASFST